MCQKLRVALRVASSRRKSQKAVREINEMIHKGRLHEGNENLNTPTNREILALVGSVICVIVGPVLLILAVTADPLNQWAVVASIVPIAVSWGLAQKSGMMCGKRQGRLEERKRKEEE